MTTSLDDEDISRAVLTSSNVATAVIGIGDVIGYANAAFVRISGYSASELRALRAGTLFVDAPSLDAADGGCDERQLIHPDGSTTWVRVITAPLSCAGIGHHGLVLQLIDIDRQKQTEIELLRSESRLNFALEAAAQGVWDHDILTDRMYYSPGWRRMRGIPPGEVIDGSLEAWLERMHQDDRRQVLEAIRREEAGGRGFRVLEYRERHRDGRYIWIQSRGQNVAWDANGNATRTLGTDTDVTDRKLADDELRRLSQRLELALDASKIGVWEQNLTTGHVVWDRRMDEIYTRDPRIDLPDHYWSSTVHPDDRESAAFDVSQALEGNATYQSQFRIVLPNGEIRHLRSRAQVFDDPDGSRKFIGTEWDVTADVRLNEELQRAKALAESRYAELKEAQARIQYAALHDELTDLPNRRYLNQVLLERRAQARERGQNLALLHLDLDWFKEINDRLGHAAGDVMLQHVADLLRSNVREDDFIARIGGDEFVLLCWFDGNVSDLRIMAERIISQLRDPVPFEGQAMRVGASIGIAYETADGAVSRHLLREADIALYRAKESGRNRYEFAAA